MLMLGFEVLKRPPITLPYSIIMVLQRFFANGKLTASCQTNVSPKRYIKRYKRQKWTFEKLLG